MKLTIELNLEDFYEYGDGLSFKDVVISEAIRQITLRMLGDEIDPDLFRSAMKCNIDRIIKENEQRIIDTVLDRVSDKVIAKKKLKNEMPKASELAGLNKENKEYFMTLIDEAIAKRFRQ